MPESVGFKNTNAISSTKDLILDKREENPKNIFSSRIEQGCSFTLMNKAWKAVLNYSKVIF